MKFPFQSPSVPATTQPATPGAPTGMEIMAFSLLSKIGIDPQAVVGFLKSTGEAVLNVEARLVRIEQQQSELLAELRAKRNGDSGETGV